MLRDGGARAVTPASNNDVGIAGGGLSGEPRHVVTTRRDVHTRHQAAMGEKRLDRTSERMLVERARLAVQNDLDDPTVPVLGLHTSSRSKIGATPSRNQAHLAVGERGIAGRRWYPRFARYASGT